jgi:hypothetical protein
VGIMGEESVYYRNTGRIPVASKASLHVRKKMFELFMQVMRPSESISILDLGVTSDGKHPESNFFEQLYPYKHRIVCAGTEDGSYLEKRYPGTRFISIRPGEPLPFPNEAFGIVFSNAVIEHAGNEAAQKNFVREVLRVGKSFFITTPNRIFPIEMHTGLPLLHYLPKTAHRYVLTKLGYGYWATEANLNLLHPQAFRRLFPSPVLVKIKKIRLLGITSNLIAYPGR